jgi:hypothetical protein
MSPESTQIFFVKTYQAQTLRRFAQGKGLSRMAEVRPSKLKRRKIPRRLKERTNRQPVAQGTANRRTCGGRRVKALTEPGPLKVELTLGALALGIGLL